MNIPYLLKILGTNKLSELVANIDLPPLDMNLAVFDAEKSGQIEVDRDKDKVKALVEPEITFDSDLASKLLRMIKHYEAQETNITRGTLNKQIKDPVTGLGYPYHDYLMALQYLIDSDQVIQLELSVPAVKDKRPAHIFAFLCLPENDNEEWNAREVNKWIANWNKSK